MGVTRVGGWAGRHVVPVTSGWARMHRRCDCMCMCVPACIKGYVDACACKRACVQLCVETGLRASCMHTRTPTHTDAHTDAHAGAAHAHARAHARTDKTTGGWGPGQTDRGRPSRLRTDCRGSKNRSVQKATKSFTLNIKCLGHRRVHAVA